MHESRGMRVELQQERAPTHQPTPGKFNDKLTWFSYRKMTRSIYPSKQIYPFLSPNPEYFGFRLVNKRLTPFES